MPLAENLIEGLGRAAGATGLVGDIEKKKQERTDLGHAELQAKADQILGDVKQLQSRKAALDPQSPTYQQDVAGIEKSLGEHQKAFSDVFHPTKNPNAFQNLGRYLEKHIGKKEPAPLPASNAVTPERMAGLQSSAAGPGTPSDLTPEEAKRKARIAAGLEPRAVADKPESENWIPSDVTFADGTKATLQRNSKDGRWTDLAGNPIPAERLATASVAPKTAPKDKYAWTKKNGKFVSVKLDANGQIIPGSENQNILPPASLTGRISTGQYHFVDDKGQVHEIQETRSSMPAGQGAQTISTPGQAKARAASVAPAGVGRDNIIGFKGNKEYQDTRTSLHQAQSRMDTMDQNLTAALKGDQQAMLSMVANHIGMTLGAQKGARITRAVWDEAVQSAPWLQRAASRFDDRGFLSGVTLAPEQMKQMVRLAHEKVGTLQKDMSRLDTERGPTAPPAGGGETKTYQGHTYTKQPDGSWKLTK